MIFVVIIEYVKKYVNQIISALIILAIIQLIWLIEE